MNNLQREYELIQEGKGNKDHFLKLARLAFPNHIGVSNTYDQTVSILKGKSLLAENKAGGVVTSGRKDWFKIFEAEVKAEIDALKAELHEVNLLNAKLLYANKIFRAKNLKEAQKNMVSFSIILIFVNILFLALGLLLTQYAAQNGVTATKDDLFPTIAMLPEIGVFTSSFFLLGLIAAAYSSADSALTSLTTSFCIDIIELDKKPKESQKKVRKRVHIGVSVLLIFVIVMFEAIFKDVSVIWELFKAAGYTYGPLLGLFAFGILTKTQLKDKYVWIIALIAPILSFIINAYSVDLLNGYQIGFEILIINGLLTFLGLILIRSKQN